MANKAADDLSKNAPKFGTEAECKAKGGYCNWYSMSGCKTGEEMIAGCSETLSNAPCCIPKSTSSTSSSTPYRPDQPRDTGGLVPCDTNCTLCHIVIGFKRIFDFLLGLLFVATMLAITASGVFYMFSTGSKALIDLGKKAITYSITAFVIGMTSWLIVNTIMVMVGFKHPKGGNWWQFTCDTTKASPVGTAPKTGEGQPRPSGGGSCAGMNTTVQNQCELTSQDLEALMNCMSNQGAPGTVTSISDSVVGNNFEQARACCGSGSCKHASMSCHYGCGLADQGYSHAMDVAAGSSDEELCRVASIAKGCGAGRIWGPRTLSCGITFYEGHKHLHISTSACNH